MLVYLGRFMKHSGVRLLIGKVSVPMMHFFWHVLVWVTRGALVAHWYTYSILRCGTSPYCRTFIFPSQCPCGMILILYLMLWDWQVSRAGPMLFSWPELLYPFLSFNIFPFLFFLSISWYCGAVSFGQIKCKTLSPSFAVQTSFNINNVP